MVYEKIIKSYDGTELYFKKDLPTEAKAIVVVIHGLGEHCGRYDYVVQSLLNYGYGVYRFDNRGHGKSGGARGYLDDFHKFIDDADHIVEIAKKENPNLPIFMLGHSMGGTITALYGVKYPNKLNGQILSGPCTMELDIFDELKKLDVENQPLMPIDNGLSHLICRSQKVVDDYNNDPFVLKNFTLKLISTVFFDGIHWFTENIKKYNYPCLLMHGENDQIVSKQNSENLYNNSLSEDKTMEIWPKLYHEILNEEKEKDLVLEKIHEWIEKRI